MITYKEINGHFDDCKEELSKAIVELALIQPLIIKAHSKFTACGNDTEAEAIIREVRQLTCLLEVKAAIIYESILHAHEAAIKAKQNLINQHV